MMNECAEGQVLHEGDQREGENMTREEVIAALKCCIVKDPDDKMRCTECPYRDPNSYCLNRLKSDALALLEGEAARLLTAEDFNAEDADAGGAIPCWKESKSPTRRSGWAVICYGKWLADKDVARYWTGKPTEAEREATPWT